MLLAMAMPVQTRKPLTTEEHALRWDEVVAEYESIPVDGWSVETDAFGNVLMFPLPEGLHQSRGSTILQLLKMAFPDHEVLYERPVATDIGTRNADVVLVEPHQIEQALGKRALIPAPKVCVEVWSPSNDQEEMNEKRDAYLRAGAQEVWFCDRSEHMTFFDVNGPLTHSKVCPEFPKVLDLSLSPITQMQQEKKSLQQESRRKDDRLLAAYDFIVKTPEDRARLESADPELVAERDRIVGERKREQQGH
jgi:Uma2 family endonuclease